MAAASLRALLANSIDYAGLFPPAELALEPALRNHAEYIRTADAWMLGTFILPVAQFDAASEFLSRFDRGHPLRVSALGKKTDNASAFADSLRTMGDEIRSFVTRHEGLALVDQVEMPVPADVDAAVLREIPALPGDLKLKMFWEAHADLAGRTIELISEHNAANAGLQFGYKLRTGGVKPDAFPSSGQIAGALVAAAKLRVPIKFTAGLHHPIRQYHASVATKMHGFLNVLGAGVLAAEHGWSVEQTARMLDDEDPASFSVRDDCFSWREWKVATARIATHRKVVTSFGSCSFDEPREDLRALKLL